MEVMGSACHPRKYLHFFLEAAILLLGRRGLGVCALGCTQRLLGTINSTRICVPGTHPELNKPLFNPNNVVVLRTCGSRELQASWCFLVVMSKKVPTVKGDKKRLFLTHPPSVPQSGGIAQRPVPESAHLKPWFLKCVHSSPDQQWEHHLCGLKLTTK